MMGGFGVMGSWGFGMMIMPLAVLGLVGWAIVSLTRRQRENGDGRALPADRSGRGSLGKRREPDALSLAILQERYAEGSLDTETYRRMREELEA